MINEKATIAIPYYGSLIRPGRGLEKIFIKGDFDPGMRQLENISVSIWNPKSESRLHKWLASQGVSGIFCSDRNAHYEALLSEEGIWMRDDEDAAMLSPDLV